MTVVVVGGGLAGSIAALAAARHRDVEVRLLTAGETTLQSASGLVDVLGYTPEGEGPLTDPYDAIPRLPADHPYSTVGVDAVREGLALFDDVANERYSGEHTEENALVPTYAGNLKPTARYPDSVAPGVASRDAETLFVGFEELTAFDAPLVGDRLAERLYYPLWGTTASFPKNFQRQPDVTDFATALERDDPAGEAGEAPDSVRESLVEEMRMYLDFHERVGLPAILGQQSVDEIRDQFQEELEVRVFEVPMGPPSVPGRRLESTLRSALQEAGVEIVPQIRVTGAESDGDRIERLTTETEVEESTTEATSVVLATGGLVGGGIDSDRQAVREPVFDCHVEHPGDRYEWFDGDALGEHPFAAFGVDTDEELRPLDARGRPEFENLHAAGSVLGGYDFAAEKSGSGVSIATGYVAGRLAAEESS